MQIIRLLLIDLKIFVVCLWRAGSRKPFDRYVTWYPAVEEIFFTNVPPSQTCETISWWWLNYLHLGIYTTFFSFLPSTSDSITFVQWQNDHSEDKLSIQGHLFHTLYDICTTNASYNYFKQCNVLKTKRLLYVATYVQQHFKIFCSNISQINVRLLINSFCRATFSRGTIMNSFLWRCTNQVFLSELK